MYLIPYDPSFTGPEWEARHQKVRELARDSHALWGYYRETIREAKRLRSKPAKLKLFRFALKIRDVLIAQKSGVNT